MTHLILSNSIMKLQAVQYHIDFSVLLKLWVIGPLALSKRLKWGWKILASCSSSAPPDWRNGN